MSRCLRVLHNLSVYSPHGIPQGKTTLLIKPPKTKGSLVCRLHVWIMQTIVKSPTEPNWGECDLRHDTSTVLFIIFWGLIISSMKSAYTCIVDRVSFRCLVPSSLRKSENKHEKFHPWWQHSMGVFRVTGPMWGESSDHRWIPLTKSQWCGLWCLCGVILNIWLNK